ncbi:MAG: N-6 DNA methylase [Lautropia mirabilis]
MTDNPIVARLWAQCDILRDDGINYSDYVTELVLLLFLKMEHELKEEDALLPADARWERLLKLDGAELRDTYREMLLRLSRSKEKRIAAIYADAQSRIKEPRHLKALITNLDGIQWFDDDRDGLGDLYEGLLEKNASETKSGAGQYFTPRPLIDAIIDVMQPQAGEVIQDPAAGTAGFLIAANRYIRKRTDDLFNLSREKQDFQREQAFVGMELVASTRRLALMNCMLHDIFGTGEGAVQLGNTLGPQGKTLKNADVILSNPPFGSAKGGGGPTRDDFTFKTSNKQLAFVQHFIRSLKDGGRAAVVLPDNVLFESGIGTDIRQDLMKKCRLHTILRLPTGIFYAQGVKTNVLFFEKISNTPREDGKDHTDTVWVYDARTNAPKFGKRTPLTKEYFADFIQAYGDDAKGKAQRTDAGETGRWRSFSREWIRKEKGDSLDISWLKDESLDGGDELPEPAELAREALAELEAAIEDIDSLLKDISETND